MEFPLIVNIFLEQLSSIPIKSLYSKSVVVSLNPIPLYFTLFLLVLIIDYSSLRLFLTRDTGLLTVTLHRNTVDSHTTSKSEYTTGPRHGSVMTAVNSVRNKAVTSTRLARRLEGRFS